MKLKQLITGGALAATVLTLGSAQAGTNYNGIVFCKARIMSSGLDPRQTVSITLPFTTTDPQGDQYTYWNLGTVPPGGVADSWHSEGGPGKFVAHNNGEAGAYVYLTSSGNSYCDRWDGDGANLNDIYDEADEFMGTNSIRPVPSLRYLKNQSKYEEESYCLAFSKDVTAKVPTWHMLDRYCNGGKYDYDGSNKSNWRTGDEYDGAPGVCIGAYMGHLDAGEYMAFDVKFWAPLVPYNWNFGNGDYRPNVRFSFMVEAAAFPLWDHDIEVQ